MVSKSTYKFLGVIAILVFVYSCSGFQKIMKNPDSNFKYDKAIEYFNKKDYYHSQMLLEELINVVRGTSKAKEVLYHYSYTYYYMDEYYMASYYFSSFAKTYPFDDRAEEMDYMSAFCNYLNSPNYSLDQSNTYQAIEEMQMFLNKYPKSSRSDTCNILIDKLRYKLETKYYQMARLYYKMENYEAAIVAFDNMISDFPTTEYKEVILYEKVKSAFYLANNSVETKKENRLKNAIKYKIEFEACFPESKYLKEIKSIGQNASKQLEQI